MENALKSPADGKCLDDLFAFAPTQASVPLPPEPVLLGAVGSVLDEAHARIGAGELPPWGSVLARSQREGRGQLRRHWHSPEGNVYAALHLPRVDPFVGSEAAPALGALMAAALGEVCRGEGNAGGRPLNVRFKWPNDVVCLQGGTPYKVGGILLEERHGSVVAGMGINVAYAPPKELLRKGHAMPAACLSDFSIFAGQQEGSSTMTGTHLAERLWRHLVRTMYFWYTKEFLSPSRWLLLAEQYLLWKNRTVFLGDEPEDVRGILLGLAPSGGVRLLVEGREEVFFSGSLGAADV